MTPTERAIVVEARKDVIEVLWKMSGDTECDEDVDRIIADAVAKSCDHVLLQHDCDCHFCRDLKRRAALNQQQPLTVPAAGASE